MNQDGRLEVFTNGSGSAVWHQWQTAAATLSWTGNNPLGGVISGSPTAVSNSDGRLEIFVQGGNAVFHNWQVTPGGGWSGWYALGGISVSHPPSAIETANGTLQIFAVQNGVVYTNEEIKPGNSSSWTGWTAIGGANIATTPSVVKDFLDNLYIFAQGSDSAAWFNYQISPNGGWNGWTSLGGVIYGSPSAAVNSDGRVEIFALGEGSSAYHIWQLGNGSWSNWAGLGGVIQGVPFVAANADGHLEIFALGGGNNVFHDWQTAPGDSNDWVGWQFLNSSLASYPVVSRNIDGRLEVFGEASDGNTWHSYQLGPNGGWSGWYSLVSSSGPAPTQSGANYDFGVKGGLLTRAENDANFNFRKKTKTGQAPGILGWGQWPCATVTVSFFGFESSYDNALQAALDNWNKALKDTYGSNPPVQFLRGPGPDGGLYSLTIRNAKTITKDSGDPNSIGPYVQGYAHVLAAGKDSNNNFLNHVDIDVIYLIKNSQTLTNVVAHEIGHTFSLAHCDNCPNKASVMSTNLDVAASSLLMCKSLPGSLPCRSQVVNLTQGLPSPTLIDMSVVQRADPGLAACQKPPGSDSPPLCRSAEAQPAAFSSFASDGTPGSTVYSCDGETTCDACNGICSYYSQSDCGQSSSPPPTPPPPPSCPAPEPVCAAGSVPACSPEGLWYCDFGCPGPEPAPCCEECYEACEGNQWVCVGSPVVLDVLGNGFHLSDIKHGVQFRVLPGQVLHQMSWPEAPYGNGWLALDRNGNGKIDDFTELFGNATPQPRTKHPNGYLALSVFDDPANGGNGNGFIDPGDSVFNHLLVWIDDNHNGISEPSELHSLQEAGIFKIDLDYSASPYEDENGNQFRYRSRIWDKAGKKHDACYDVFLRIAN